MAEFGANIRMNRTFKVCGVQLPTLALILCCSFITAQRDCEEFGECLKCDGDDENVNCVNLVEDNSLTVRVLYTSRIGCIVRALGIL